MNKKYCLALILCLTACSSGGSLMSMTKFYDIPIGATETEVVSSMGKPYAIKRASDGSEEYEYVERIKIGARDAEERHYYLYIKDGKVTSKKVKQTPGTPYTFDSYEIQTTQSLPPEAEEQQAPQASVK